MIRKLVDFNLQANVSHGATRERKDSFLNKDADLCAVRYNTKVSGNVCRLITGVDVLNGALLVAKLTWSRWKGKN